MMNSHRSPDQNRQEILAYIRASCRDAAHPFRYLTLSTTDQLSRPHSRMLVLRDLSADDALLMFTDSRAAKVEQLELNPNGAVLFWHPEQQLQVSMRVQLGRITDAALLESYRSQIKGRGARSYTSIQPPGTIIAQPEQAQEFYAFDENNYFSAISGEIVELVALQLGDVMHLRLRCVKESGRWSCSWIVP